MAVIASVTGLNVAQPQLAVEFDAAQDTVLWMINIYTLGLAALLLPLGAVGDRWGRKPVLLAGLAVFGVASAAAGLAPSTEVMLAARLLAGAGAAMIMPVTLAVITSTFPDEERSKAIGVWTGVARRWRHPRHVPVGPPGRPGELAVALRPAGRARPGRRRPDAPVGAELARAVGARVRRHRLADLGRRRARAHLRPPRRPRTGLDRARDAAEPPRRSRRRDRLRGVGAAPGGALLDVRLFRRRDLAGGSVSLLGVFSVQAASSSCSSRTSRPCWAGPACAPRWR